jgi:hypothetical protein
MWFHIPEYSTLKLAVSGIDVLSVKKNKSVSLPWSKYFVWCSSGDTRRRDRWRTNYSWGPSKKERDAATQEQVWAVVFFRVCIQCTQIVCTLGKNRRQYIVLCHESTWCCASSAWIPIHEISCGFPQSWKAAVVSWDRLLPFAFTALPIHCSYYQSWL